MKKEVLNKLQYDAFAIIANFVAKTGYGYGKTGIVTEWLKNPTARGNAPFQTKTVVEGNGKVKIELISNPDCYVRFTSIRPNQDAKLTFHPFEITNKNTSGVFTQQTTNLTGSPVTRRFILAKTEETSQGSNVGVGISATIGGSVTVGSTTTQGYEVGVNFSATVSASYDKSYSSSTSKTESREVLVDVAPRSIMYMDLQKSTADYSQKTDCDATFDYGIEINLNDKASELGIENFKFSSISDMLTYADGYGNPEDTSNGWWVKLINKTNKNPATIEFAEQLATLLKANPVKYSYTNKFSGASTGEVKLRETDLNNKEFNYNA